MKREDEEPEGLDLGSIVITRNKKGNKKMAFHGAGVVILLFVCSPLLYVLWQYVVAVKNCSS